MSGTRNSKPNDGAAVRESFEQQRDADIAVDMWIFLATEVMFFGGLFMAYIVYRHEYPHAFAVASKHTNLFYGTLNTAILRFDKQFVDGARGECRQGKSAETIGDISAAYHFCLRLDFFGVKALEYSEDLREHLLPGHGFSVPEAPKTDISFFFIGPLPVCTAFMC